MSEVVGIGVDCEKISRFKNLNDMFFAKNFTKSEIEYCRKRKNSAQHFAGRFACKEAIIKAFGASGKKVTFGEIEITNDGNGAPKARILGEEANGTVAVVSISHSDDMAIAFAVLRK